MQTARRMEERSHRFPRRDRVLDRLIVEGTFDHVAPDYSSFAEEMAMHHSSAMVQRLLMRIECMESEVRLLCVSQRGCLLMGSWVQLENVKTTFKFLLDKVYDHMSGEAEKEPRLWQALGEQDFWANKFNDLLCNQEKKREALEARVAQQAAELERLLTEVTCGRGVHHGGLSVTTMSSEP